MEDQLRVHSRGRQTTLIPPKKASLILKGMVMLQWAVFSSVLWFAVNSPQEDVAGVFIFPALFVLPALLFLTIRVPISWIAFSLMLFSVAGIMYGAGGKQIILYMTEGRHWTLWTKCAAVSMPLLGLMAMLTFSKSLFIHYHVRTKLSRVILAVALVAAIVAALTQIL